MYVCEVVLGMNEKKKTDTEKNVANLLQLERHRMDCFVHMFHNFIDIKILSSNILTAHFSQISTSLFFRIALINALEKFVT